MIICVECKGKHNLKIPLIATLVFTGASQWCPYCGNKDNEHGGIFLQTESIELDRLKKRYEAYSDEFLKSCALFSNEMSIIDGKEFLRKDIPEEILAKARRVINSYQFKHKIK